MDSLGDACYCGGTPYACKVPLSGRCDFYVDRSVEDAGMVIDGSLSSDASLDKHTSEHAWFLCGLQQELE